MKRFIMLFCVLSLIISMFAGCGASEDSNDPKKLIIGTWQMTHECKDDEEYEVEDGYVVTFYADGTTNQDAVWLLQGDYLTLGNRTHYVKSLTKDKMIFTEKEKHDGAYFIFEKVKKGDTKYKIPDSYAKDIIGRWIEPQYRNYYVQFNEDGTGITDSGDQYYPETFTWKIFDGNRLKIWLDSNDYDEDPILWLIVECNENILSFYGREDVLTREY